MAPAAPKVGSLPRRYHYHVAKSTLKRVIQNYLVDGREGHLYRFSIADAVVEEVRVGAVDVEVEAFAVAVEHSHRRLDSALEASPAVASDLVGL